MLQLQFDMDKRKEDLNKLGSYINEIDKDLTMILQTLQWDRKHIREHHIMTTCKYDSNHKVLSSKLDEHEQECLLRHNGYTKNDQLLPDPVDTNISTLVKFNREDIEAIINNAAKFDKSFKRVYDTLYGSVQQYSVCLMGSGSLEPLSLDRLQYAYSSDERRAIHDAVVRAAPSCHDLADLALPSATDSTEPPKTKSRMEILAELRDMRRRRTKYRVATKSRNYSDVLRDVIRTQMEHFTGIQGDLKPDVNELNSNIVKETEHRDTAHYRNGNYKNDRERVLSSRVNIDTDEQQKGRERSNRSHRSRERHDRKLIEDESGDRRGRHNSRERRHSRRDNKDYRCRDRPREIKHEVLSDDDSATDKFNFKEGKYGIKYRGTGSKYDKVDRESSHHRYREERDEDRNRDQKYCKKDKTRSKDRYVERREDLLDKERARNLITEIRREIESVESEGIVKCKREGTHVRSTIEIRQDKHYRNEKFKSAKHSYINKTKELNFPNQREDSKSQRKRTHDERIRSQGRSDKHEEGRSDRSGINETKRSRTEDKQRLYNEVYSD